MKKCRFPISFILVLCLLFSFTVSAADVNEIPYKSYTYWVDYNTSEKTAVYSKPMYEVKNVVDSRTIGADDTSKLTDVAVFDGRTYILDSGSSKIYVLDSKYAPLKTLAKLEFNGEPLNFTDAQGIYVDKSGLIYIADTENGRVIVLNFEGRIERLLLLPDSPLIPTGFQYRPVKVAVDSKGYTYIASDGSYYGAILYSPQMEFLGFFGANTVKTTVLGALQNLWKRLTSNDIKRAADELSLPYMFTDIVVDSENFIYTATGKSGDDEIQHGQIRRFNPGGKDILNASDINFADSQVSNYQYSQQIQSLGCLDVDSDGFLYALDTTTGRIYWYDAGCNLLSVFGGSIGDGEQNGTFILPTAIAVNGTDILVTDSTDKSLTVFSETDYGALVRSAQLITLKGDFAAAREPWEQVIAQDINNQLGYRGLAKAYYDSGEYDKTMEYAKLGVDRETYAKAFELKRTQVIESHFYLIAAVVVLLAAAIVAWSVLKRKKGITLIHNVRLKTAFSSVLHPVESFRLVKEKGAGSLIISVVILALFYVITVVNDTMGGFAFTVFDSESYNAIYVFLSTVGLVILWTVSNWLVCTLAGGIGKLKEIFIVTCYSLIPILFAKTVRVILTHILIPSEGAFLDIFVVICTAYAAFMLIIGIMRIHDYEFGKFLGTTIFTVIGMLIIVLLLFLVFLISQQLFAWLKTLYIELRYR